MGFLFALICRQLVVYFYLFGCGKALHAKLCPFSVIQYHEIGGFSTFLFLHLIFWSISPSIQFFSRREKDRIGFQDGVISKQSFVSFLLGLRGSFSQAKGQGVE